MVRTEQPAVMETPKISVVIPTYNHADYVGDTLRSLSCQVPGTPPYEVVVVDDGSTDRTPQVLARLSDSCSIPLRTARLPARSGRSVARNTGIDLARADIIAFTDSDCLPAADWLLRGWQALSSTSAGMVQGRTTRPPDVRVPLFSHFIEMESEDGSYSTCNIFYRRAVLEDTGGFDPAVEYWEDADLGWRARRLGWTPAYDSRVVVYHQVIALTMLEWLSWPRKFGHLPLKAARYPESRSHLFAGFFVDKHHAAFTLALLGALLATRRRSLAVVLALPYAISLLRRHGYSGRLPLLKAGLHLSWDLVAFGVLLFQSIRSRSLVL